VKLSHRGDPAKSDGQASEAERSTAASRLIA